MSDLAAILEKWRALGAAAHDAVLATIVHVEGSAYRRPGARMLILGDGTRLGTISGGCLESEVVRKAWWWTEDGAAIRTFDSSSEDGVRDFGLGCSGVITILLERVATSGAQHLLKFLDASLARRLGAVVATVVRTASSRGDVEVGEHVLFGRGGIAIGRSAMLALELGSAAEATAAERRSRLVHLAGADVFVEWVGPPQRLFVFGAGHDVVPVAALADMMGWSVTVADTHAAWLEQARFPRAHRLFTVPSCGDIAPLAIGQDDAVVLMTHNFPQDLLLLPQLVRARPRYLGLLGSRTRAQKLFAEVGADLSAANVHAPVGLDLGGDRPETIALAIAAEIQAVLHGQPAAQLRVRKGAIHAPALEVGAGDTVRSERPIRPTCELVHA